MLQKTIKIRMLFAAYPIVKIILIILNNGKGNQAYCSSAYIFRSFNWPVKIAYALSCLQVATAEQIASFIAEIEGNAAQKRITEVNQL